MKIVNKQKRFFGGYSRGKLSTIYVYKIDDDGTTRTTSTEGWRAGRLKELGLFVKEKATRVIRRVKARQTFFLAFSLGTINGFVHTDVPNNAFIHPAMPSLRQRYRTSGTRRISPDNATTESTHLVQRITQTHLPVKRDDTAGDVSVTSAESEQRFLHTLATSP